MLECVEEFVGVAAEAMKDSDNVVQEGSVDKAVQVMANIAALQHCLPRFFGTLMRGMCHIGLIKSEELEDTFSYCEKTLKATDRSCDSQVGSTYSLVYEISRNKIDSHINYSLENFNWVAKAARDMPNAYCEGLIGYLRSVFASLGPMDEGSRAGLHFSCLGHVSERLVKLFSGKPGDTASMDDGGIPPISRIDAFGIKNLATDVEEFERFADSLVSFPLLLLRDLCRTRIFLILSLLLQGIPQLRDCFNELKVLTGVMLDKELPILLLPENSAARRRKYPILSMEKVVSSQNDFQHLSLLALRSHTVVLLSVQGNILEKYVGTGLVSANQFLCCSLVMFASYAYTANYSFLGGQAHGWWCEEPRLPLHRQEGGPTPCQDCPLSRLLIFLPYMASNAKRSDSDAPARSILRSSCVIVISTSLCCCQVD